MSVDRAELFKLSHDPTSKYYIEPEHFDKVYFPHVKNGFKVRDGVILSNMFRNMSIIKNIPVRPDDTFLG